MELVGKNEGISYVKSMVHQRAATGMEYPSDTNMRGNSKQCREYHAAGDMVGKADGDMVGKADGDMVKKAMGGMMRPSSGVMQENMAMRPRNRF